MAKRISDESADKAQIENAVRTAAISAAKGVPLSEAYITKIIADTNDASLSAADRVQRATTMAEQYVTAPKALNTFSASPKEEAAQKAAASIFNMSSRLRAAPTPAAESFSAKGGGYAPLIGSDPRTLQGMAGLGLPMLSYLHAYDRSFTAQNVLNAANDSIALGFSVKDRAAMLDHTTIDRYDPRARETNKALQNYQERIERDDQLADLHDKAKHAKTPEQRKAIEAEAGRRRGELAEQSGLTERIEDKGSHPKAKAATRRRKTAIEKKAEEKYKLRATHDGAAKLTEHKGTKASTDLFKKLTSGSPK